MKVKRVVALSTDKASSPINLYGATKLASDKMFTYIKCLFRRTWHTIFCSSLWQCIGLERVNNSLIHELKSVGTLPITDKRMTRFFITLDEAVETVELAFNKMVGSEIFVKKMPL